MDIINDFAVLAIAIAVTYPTFRFWRYLTSRATLAGETPSTLEKQIEVLEESVRRINESKNIWTRLSQSEHRDPLSCWRQFADAWPGVFDRQCGIR